MESNNNEFSTLTPGSPKQIQSKLGKKMMLEESILQRKEIDILYTVCFYLILNCKGGMKQNDNQEELPRSEKAKQNVKAVSKG